METLDLVSKVGLFVFVVCSLLFMARVERFMRAISHAALRMAEAIERSVGKGPAPPPPPGPTPSA